jgi:hypothetical protein
MRKPKRPGYPPRRPANRPASRPPLAGAAGTRVRSPLDAVAAIPGVEFKVLGRGIDRQALMSFANPMEMMVIHGFTHQIDEEYRRVRQRPDDFWLAHPELHEQAQKIDNVLATVMERRAGSGQR